MPVHDWSQVLPGIFHDFRFSWVARISDALNSRLLPKTHYALLERPPVHRTAMASDRAQWDEHGGTAIAVKRKPPRVRFIETVEPEIYAHIADRIAIYRSDDDHVMAYIEIVSPGNKHSDSSVRKFLAKLEEALERGCHLLVIDPHPPTGRDPNGLHARFWTEVVGQPDSPGVTAEESLAVMAYRSDVVPTAYFTPFAVGGPLPEMPLFLDPDRYIDVPLEQTYQNAWKSVPARWKHVIEGE